tara:strand:- start:594 stop:764 length:171 start_codon:yes stop_codon:yes gene_type:complete
MKEAIGYLTRPVAAWLKKAGFTYVGVPNEFLEKLGLKPGDAAKIKFDGEKIIIEKA